MEKVCKDCQEVKDLSEYNRAGKYYQAFCKKCGNIRHKLWAIKHKRQIKYIQAKFKLGITKEEFNRITKKRNACEICGVSEKDYGHFLSIDHSHITGQFRGQLCSECNHGIGKFKDSVVLLRKAIMYLKKYESRV